MKKCTQPDCNGELLARGLCRKHYLRWYKHGDATFIVDRKKSAKRGIDLPQTKHGLWNHPLYAIWNTMMKRCYNVKNKSYHRYGGRGISVCDRWHDVRNFVEDMHPREAGKSLDRIDNNGNYEKNNCRWATSLEQARNRPQATLTEFQRSEAIRLYKENGSPKKIGEILGLNPSSVKNVVYGNRKRIISEVE